MIELTYTAQDGLDYTVRYVERRAEPDVGIMRSYREATSIVGPDGKEVTDGELVEEIDFYLDEECRQ